MKEEISVLIDEEKLQKRVKELAEQINKDYEGKKIHLICILKGSVFFTCELAKHIKVPVIMDFMTVSSYGDGLKSSGYINIEQDFSIDIKGRDVLVIEDIVDSGRTLAYLAHMMKKREPSSLKVCALLDKPEHRETEITVDYSGFAIDDAFIVGFGLDYAQKYRNLPYIGVLNLKED